MDKIHFQLGNVNQIHQPNFHDSHLYKLEFMEDAVELGFRLADGALYRLLLSGKVVFKGNGLREGNIIFNITIEEGENADLSLLNEILDIRPDTTIKQQHNYLQNTRDQVKKKQLKVIYISPSYGAEIMALCKTIEVFPVEPE